MSLFKKSKTTLISLLAAALLSYNTGESNAQIHSVSDTTIVNTVDHYSPELPYPHIFELDTRKNYESERFLAVYFSSSSQEFVGSFWRGEFT